MSAEGDDKEINPALLTEQTVSALGDSAGSLSMRERDNDENSTMSTISGVSMRPSPHSAKRGVERSVSDTEIQEAKKRGNMSLSIHFHQNEDKDQAAAEIYRWKGQLTGVFKGLSAKNTVARGRQGDHRLELELGGSENRGVEIKGWLNQQGYFQNVRWPRRVLFSHQQGQKELVVVEGLISTDNVGVITVFWTYFDTHDFAVDFYNNVYLGLLVDNADVSTLDSALIAKGHVRIDECSGMWVVGPTHRDYSLSTWPKNKTYLHQAALVGRAEMVGRLVRHYRCSVDIRCKDGGTALHLAAYYGHAHVISILLELDADQTITNKLGETALASARQAQHQYSKGRFKFPSVIGGNQPLNFLERDGWPHWEQVIQLLSRAKDVVGTSSDSQVKRVSVVGTAVLHDDDLENMSFRPTRRGRGQQEEMPL